MQARHLVLAVLLATGGASQAAAQAIGPSDTVPVPMPAPLLLEPVPVANPPLAPDATEVPEPSSIALLLAGVAGAGLLRRRRRAK